MINNIMNSGNDTLLLNTNGQPLSIAPLSTLSWQESIKLIFIDKIHVLEWHDDWVVRSQKLVIRVPSVVTTKVYVRPAKAGVNFSRHNVYARDDYKCQYCNKTYTFRELTLDHVLPKSLGGKTNWENIVTACKRCNHDKGNDPKIIPDHEPYRPHISQLKLSKNQVQSIQYESWLKYLDIPEEYILTVKKNVG